MCVSLLVVRVGVVIAIVWRISGTHTHTHTLAQCSLLLINFTHHRVAKVTTVLILPYRIFRLVIYFSNSIHWLWWLSLILCGTEAHTNRLSILYNVSLLCMDGCIIIEQIKSTNFWVIVIIPWSQCFKLPSRFTLLHSLKRNIKFDHSICFFLQISYLFKYKIAKI